MKYEVGDMFDSEHIKRVVRMNDGTWMGDGTWPPECNCTCGCSKWWMPKMEFLVWPRTINEFDYVSDGTPMYGVDFDGMIVPDSYVDHTPQDLVAKTLRFLWRVRFLRPVTRWIGEQIGKHRSDVSESPDS